MALSIIRGSRSILRLASRPSNVSSVSPFTTLGATQGPDDSGKVASSKEFKQREQGEEARYVREKEAAELRKLREELGKQQKKIDELESRLSVLEISLLSSFYSLETVFGDDLALTWIWYLPAG
ncbi:expressed protein [Phakopsora pachyrhizi]|uniref:ATPase inhibitor, mitochondrial n=1 Tax=Phakopsora pachyrhizi TaxID=170000 RepID=A0AAV0B5U4_PHAPC|nr:expressed protein [Phakopsora pachyrhizi]